MFNNLIKYKNKVFQKYITYFLIILVIPMILNIVLISKTMSDNQKKVTEINESMLNQIKNYMDEQIAAANTICMEIALNSTVAGMLRRTEVNSVDSIFDVQELTKVVSSLNNVNHNNVSEIYIFFKNSNIIIGNLSKYSPLEYYSQYLRYADIDYPDFIGEFLNNEAFMNETFIETVSGNRIIYKKAIPLSSDPNSAKAMAVIQLSTDYLKTVPAKFTYPNMALLIMDNDKVLYENNNPMITNKAVLNPETSKIKDRDGVWWTVVSAMSGAANWQYYLFTPEADLFKDANAYKFIIMLSLIIILIAGITVSFLLASKVYKPISDIVDTIEDEYKDGSLHQNEYDYISASFKNMASEKRKLIDDIEEQKPLLKQNFFYNLLTGLITSPSEVDVHKEFLQIKLVNQAFSVAALKTGSSSLIEDDFIIKVYDMFSLSGFYSYACKISTGVTAFVINGDFSSNYRESFRAIFKLLNENISDDFSVGISSISYDILDLSALFAEAQTAISGKRSDSQETMFYFDDIVDNKNSPYYYPLDMEMQIINNIKIGNIERASDILNEILEKNFKENKISNEIAEYLFSDIVGTIIKTIALTNIDFSSIIDKNDNINERLINCSSVEQMKNIIVNLMRAINEIEQERKTNPYLLEKVEKYVYDNYLDYSLSLASAADYVGVSSAHLSRYFKSKTGETFLNYVTKLRILKAKEIMKNENCSLSALAVRVGYTNESTLNRIFKKYEGITPGQYKSSIK